MVQMRECLAEELEAHLPTEKPQQALDSAYLAQRHVAYF